ncbi:CDP-glycerol glycerophosphotransferase family protein [Desulfonatronovibrio magnus]|uniref:CDP-glycerol glycerophosphotransferase family protein n=1 Tax=Desulfonatronovibrio magnus TaxID=698827 RepID=UPI0012F8112E|nr:CDP-glycerol glycerophosphotransferase family protein [Desulfonatronovibrio magnus]
MSYIPDLKQEYDILFYAERSLHLPYLEPIHDFLQTTYPHLKLIFSSPPYAPTSEDQSGVGLCKSDVQKLNHKGMFCHETSQIQAKIAVVADVCHLRIPHINRVVNVGHGLICKGLYYCRSNVTKRENLSELLCVPGPWHKRRLEDNVFIPIEVTGYIKSDMLFGPDAVDKSKFCMDMNIDPEKKIILFAPTFNEELSAIPVIKDKISELTGPDRIVMVKLHHMTDPHWVQMYQNMAREHPDIIYLDGTDYSGMMHAADVMVSDVSSMFIEFMFLNKPVVLYKNPKLEEYPAFNPNNIEYRIRDAVQEADTFSQLQHEVQKALDNPNMLSNKRKMYIEELDYGQDGQSAKRAGEAIYSRIDQKKYIPRQQQSYSIFLLLDESHDSSIVQATLEEISNKSSQHSIEIFPVSENDLDIFSLENSKYSIMANGCKTVKFKQSLAMARGSMAVFLYPGWHFPDNWLKWLNNHFLWNQGTGLVKAVQDINLIRSTFENTISDTKLPVLCKSMSVAILNLCIGKAEVNDGLPSSCAMIPLPVLRASVEAVPEIYNGEILKNLDIFVTNMGLTSLTALDTLIYPIDQLFFIWDKQALMEAVTILKNEGLMEEAVKLMKENILRFSE